MQVIYGLEAAVALFKNRHQTSVNDSLVKSVSAILADVKARGDDAVKHYSETFDKIAVDDYRVPEAAFQAALDSVDPELQTAIRLSAGRIRAYYEHQPKEGFIAQQDGALLGQVVRPLERVACYVPGGQAPLFSTLLMTAVPAQVAGVPDIVIATPPRPDGSVAPEILVAAHTLGLSTVYRMGGAHAVAALAYGTQTIKRVDKIVGPGSHVVVLAKKMVYGDVGIESLPGPTETLVLADESANPAHVAADLLAQAEHDAAQPVLVTTSQTLLDAIQDVLEEQLSTLSTQKSARESVTERGVIVKVASVQEGLEVANVYAPEHLCLLVRDPWEVVPGVKHAGGIFVGEYSMEALGDYMAGPSHVMPTGGTARFSSFVNVRDFQKVMPLIGMSASVVARIGPAAARMARAEGLEAHARAIESRLSDK